MERTTKKQLEYLVSLINTAAGTPQEPYKIVNGKYVPQAKCYHLAGEYGGWKLEQMCNEGSGVNSITDGYVSKRELYSQLRAFLAGLTAKMEI